MTRGMFILISWIKMCAFFHGVPRAISQIAHEIINPHFLSPGFLS